MRVRTLLVASLVVLAGCRSAPATLADAARNGAPEEIDRFLAADPSSLERPGADGLTPLAIAARAGNFSAIERLAKKGANLEARSPGTERTPLHEAAAANEVDAINALLAAGAKNDALDADRRTPLLLAVALKKSAAANELRFHRSNLATPTPRPVSTRFGKDSTFIDGEKIEWDAATATGGAKRRAVRDGEVPAALLRIEDTAIVGAEDGAWRVVMLTTGATVVAKGLAEQELPRGAMLQIPPGAHATIRCSTGRCVALHEKIAGPASGIELATFPRAEWSDAGIHGRTDSIAAGYFQGSHTHDFELVVVTMTGRLVYETPDGFKRLPPGSYAQFRFLEPHAVTCESAEPCTRYVVETE